MTSNNLENIQKPPNESTSSKRKSLVDSLEDDDDDEFFDARERLDDSVSLAKWSSMELENIDPETVPNARVASLKMVSISLEESVCPSLSVHNEKS